MKLTNLAILFFILEISVFAILDIRTNNLTAVTYKDIEYDKALDSAVDDGVIGLMELDSRRNLLLNKDTAVIQFYESLFANFGVIGNKRLENRLKGYIPIILVTDADGFYIYYSDTYLSNGEKLLRERWSEKIPYFHEDDRLIYHFTLGPYITIYEKRSNLIYEGDYHDLRASFPGSILEDDELFDITRRSAIINAIENKMNFYINRYNQIAGQFGITYQFWLPGIDKTDWYRTIDDISLLVIFQGYPYTAAGSDTYNRYSLGGARIKKSRTYYITEENGRKYYHRSNCTHINGQGLPYYTKEECALEGAFPCPDCNP